MILRRLMITTAAVAAALVVAGCDSSSPRAADADSGASVAVAAPSGVDPRMVERREDGVLIASRDSLLKTPGYVVDSIFPPAEALRRFREGIPGTPPTMLSGSAGSTDELLRRYWSLLATSDTAGVGDLALSKAEFAYLYVPESPEFAAGMPPEIAWLLLERSAATSLPKAVRAASALRGRSIEGTTCPTATAATPGSEVAVHGPCGVFTRTAAGIDTTWIASRVIVHRGVAKLLSFANAL